MRVVIFLSNAVAKVAIVIRQVSMGLYLPENITGPVRCSKQFFIAILPVQCTSTSTLYMGPLNNYVNKMRGGGSKMSVLSTLGV